MTHARIGDLFDSKAQTLVNTVNCVGVMGKGIALEFKKRFPDMYKDYVDRCRRGEVHLGKPYLYKRVVPPWILNFPTKDHWRSVARLNDIVRGLEFLFRHYKEWEITSLAVPPLGCGEGQLEWRVVGPTLYRYLSKMEIPVELYAPFGTPHMELQPEFLGGGSPEKESAPRSRIDPAWVALAEIVRRVENERFHWPIGRTAFQKLAYIATAEGLPTGLEFRRGSYGPYSDGLKRLTTRLVNNGLIREERLGRMFAIRPGPTLGDAVNVFRRQIESWGPIIDRVADLFTRMDTRQAEITATVVFATRELQEVRRAKPTERDVLESVMQWKQRRRPQLPEHEIARAVRDLAALGWLNVQASRDLPLPQEALAEP